MYAALNIFIQIMEHAFNNCHMLNMSEGFNQDTSNESLSESIPQDQDLVYDEVDNDSTVSQEGPAQYAEEEQQRMGSGTVKYQAAHAKGTPADAHLHMSGRYSAHMGEDLTNTHDSCDTESTSLAPSLWQRRSAEPSVLHAATAREDAYYKRPKRQRNLLK